MNCRHCNEQLEHTFVDLGFAPPSNAYLGEGDLHKPESYFPLQVKVCEHCWLVQTEDYNQADELFNDDYAYFSSTSSSWLEHASKYTNQIVGKLELGTDSFVIELASNDGYLLRNFLQKKIPCLGIEPTESTALVAEKLGIEVIREFFSVPLANKLVEQNRQADLVIGNNVFAHVPDINDFTSGMKRVLKPEGTITLEFPHLLNLVTYRQFDTIYHEHYSYLSLSAVQKIFSAHGLNIYDVEEIPTHGGSIRVYGCHQESGMEIKPVVDAMLNKELSCGLQDIQAYSDFQDVVEEIKLHFLEFLITAKKNGKKVAAYGAAAKGNTLLNYAGIKPDLLPFVCDAAKAKQGKYLPGSHIPVLSPDQLKKFQPDYLLILPWNIAGEIKGLNLFRPSTRFVTVIPELVIE